MPINDYLEMNELYHHGIKGQKWGIRRFLNEDGTLTEEGKRRYGTVENMRKRAQKDLNRNDSRIAKNIASYHKSDEKVNSLKNKLELAEDHDKNDKAERLNKKLEKLESHRSEIKSAVLSGQDNTKKLIEQINNSGLKVSNKEFSAVADRGRLLVVGTLTNVYTGIQVDQHKFKVQKDEAKLKRGYKKKYKAADINKNPNRSTIVVYRPRPQKTTSSQKTGNSTSHNPNYKKVNNKV